MIISPQKYNDRNFICIIARCMMIKTRDSQLDKIDWLVFNTNFSNISALSWYVEAIVAMIYGSWIYNYLCNQCLSPLMWVRISIRARCTTLCDKSLSVTCDRSVVFSRYSGLLHQKNWPPRYNWNIVESAVKHHQTNKLSWCDNWTDKFYTLISFNKLRHLCTNIVMPREERTSEIFPVSLDIISKKVSGLKQF